MSNHPEEHAPGCTMADTHVGGCRAGILDLGPRPQRQPKSVAVINQRAPLQGIRVLHSTHKGRDEIVLAQPTPDGTQLVEVAVGIDQLGQLVEALADLLTYLKPPTAPLGNVPSRGPAGSLEI